MAHIYAGILGPLALLTSLARGIMHGGGVDSLLWSGWCSLLVFSAIGYLIGWLAERTVADSVRDGISAELAADGSARALRVGASGTTAA